MPETGIKDTKVKKYGSLSGKYVLEEVYLITWLLFVQL